MLHNHHKSVGFRPHSSPELGFNFVTDAKVAVVLIVSRRYPFSERHGFLPRIPWDVEACSTRSEIAMRHSRAESRWPQSLPRAYHNLIKTRCLATTPQRTSIYNRARKQTRPDFSVGPDVAGKENGLRDQHRFHPRSGRTDQRAREGHRPAQTHPELAFKRVQAPTRSPWRYFSSECHLQGRL